MDCGVTVLVEDDGLVSVEAAWVVLSPILVALSVPSDVAEEVPILVVEEDAIGTVIVTVELGACVPLTSVFAETNG